MTNPEPNGSGLTEWFGVKTLNRMVQDGALRRTLVLLRVFDRHKRKDEDTDAERSEAEVTMNSIRPRATARSCIVLRYD